MGRKRRCARMGVELQQDCEGRGPTRFKGRRCHVGSWRQALAWACWCGQPCPATAEVGAREALCELRQGRASTPHARGAPQPSRTGLREAGPARQTDLPRAPSCGSSLRRHQPRARPAAQQPRSPQGAAWGGLRTRLRPPRAQPGALSSPCPKPLSCASPTLNYARSSVCATHASLWHQGAERRFPRQGIGNGLGAEAEHTTA